MKDLWGDIVERACDLLRLHEPPEGYYLAFSGGKDSVVIYDLAKRAGVKFEAWYALTTCDPPELVRFIKDKYPEVQWKRPKETFWQLVPHRGLPTRTGRYCCAELKEEGGAGRFVITGVRSAESNNRSKRRQVEVCNRGRGKIYVHPIKDWSDDDVWRYIRDNNVPYCSLYDEGFKRLGCVVCPCNRHKEQSLARWPKIWAAMKRAARRFYDRKPRDCDFETFWANWLSGDGPLWANDDDEDATGLFS